MADQTEQDSADERPKGVDIFYEKASSHRTIYADGIWAAITPSREIQLVFFKNLAPVPEYVRQAVDNEDRLDKEIEKSVKRGMVREYNATLVLNRETAEALITITRHILDLATKSLETETPIKTK